MTRPTRMTPADSAFWKMETEVARMHSVTLAVFSGPPPSPGELFDHIAARVPLVPRFRQRIVEVPLDLGRPMWVDDPEFDLHNHVINATTVGGMASVTELVSLIVSEQLDRSRPLWQVTIVDGLRNDRWALISKVHHSMIDGLYGTEPLAALIDGAGTRSVATGRWRPAPPPGGGELVGRTVAELLFNPAEQARFARSAAARQRRRWDRITGTDRSSAPGDDGPDPSGLRGPVGPSRTWSSTTVPMRRLRRARRGEVAVHDVILGLVTSGIRDLLMARNEETPVPPVSAIVPLAVADQALGFLGGVAAELVQLPVAERTVAARVEGVAAQGRGATADPANIATQLHVTAFTAPALASLGLREATRKGSGAFDAQAVIVNVPGPREELSVLGRPMTEIHPVMPLPGGVRLSVGVFSYLDQVTFGVTADRTALPDAHVVTTGIRRALDDLDHSTEGDDHASS